MDEGTSYALYLNIYIGTNDVCYDDLTKFCPLDYDNRNITDDSHPPHDPIAEVENFNHNVKALLSRVDKIIVFNSILSLLKHLDSYGSAGHDFTTPISLYLTLFHSADTSKQFLIDSHFGDFITQLSANFCNLPLLVVLLSDNPVLPFLNTHVPMDIVPVRLTPHVLNSITSKLLILKNSLQTRVSRMKNWLGFGLTTHCLADCLVADNKLSMKKSYTKYNSIDSFSTLECERVTRIAGQWGFHAHELSYDELLLTTIIIFDHVLTKSHLPIDDFYISPTDLISFLSAVRDTYHPGNPYHNFRHAVDVLQATFYFLVKINVIPPLTSSEEIEETTTTTTTDLNLASYITATDALILLIVAIGHDVGHPGVTNGFLVACKAPITKIYNDKSVLESYHSAVFNKILQAYWPRTQVKEVRELIIDSVLATDMAMHFEYMRQISHFTEEKGEDEGNNLKMASSKDITGLLCSIIMKCADISNVVRPLDISAQWGIVLAKEFSDIVALEIDLGIRKDVVVDCQVNGSVNNTNININGLELNTVDTLELAKGQLFFIGTFARPLFEAVIKVLPQLSFTLDILDDNKAYWTKQIKKVEGR